MRGWVYIFSNKAMPGLLKIGYTDRDPNMRAKELASTGVPLEFDLEYEVLVQNAHDHEQKIHAHLSSCRESDNREFFRCTLQKAIQAINEIIPIAHRLVETRPRSHNSAKPKIEETISELKEQSHPQNYQANGFYERTNPQNRPVRQPKYEIRYRGGKRYINGIHDPDYEIVKNNDLASSHQTPALQSERFKSEPLTKKFAGVDRLSSTISIAGQPSTTWSSRCSICAYNSKKLIVANRYWCSYCKVEYKDCEVAP
jgi:hypothetical protein